MTVSALVFSPLMRAGIWKVMDLPPPVGKTARRLLLRMAAWTAFSCRGSPPYRRKLLWPKYLLRKG